MRSVILVTGGAGFLGSAFVRHMLSQAAFEGQILNLDLLTSGHDLSALEEVQDDPRYFYFSGDVRDSALLETIYNDHKFDLIVHFARESRSDVSTNLLGTMQLLEFVRGHTDVHLHVVSMEEESSVKPIAEHSVLSAKGVSTSVSHSCPCFGPYQNPTAFVPSVILQCADHKKFSVVEERASDWIYVEDHAAALVHLLGNVQSGTLYHIEGVGETKALDFVYDIVDEMANILGVDSQEFVDLMDAKKEEAQRRMEKAGQAVDYTPEWELHTSLYKTIQWYLDEAEWVERRFALIS